MLDERTAKGIACVRAFVISDCELTSLACDMAAVLVAAVEFVGLRRNRMKDGLNGRACFIRGSCRDDGRRYTRGEFPF